jgi:phosphoglycolate phosphatase
LERLAASGVRTGVLSSNTAPNVRAFLARHGFAAPEILSTGVSIFGKAARLRDVMQRHRLLAADVVYVGDEVRDIEACRAAGVRSVAVSWGYGERSALLAAAPDALVDAPEELVALLAL